MRSMFYLIMLVACGCTNRPKQNTSKEQAQQSTTVAKRDASYQVPARSCDCAQLRERSERGRYLFYLEGDDSLYSGKCTEKSESGNSVERQYLAGHVVASIERKPAGSILDEMYYDTSGNMRERTRYHPNGQRGYVRVEGDHTYETFYEDGTLECKGGYGFTEKDRTDKFYDLQTPRLYDSIWKKDGSLDHVRRYSKGDITY